MAGDGSDGSVCTQKQWWFWGSFLIGFTRGITRGVHQARDFKNRWRYHWDITGHLAVPCSNGKSPSSMCKLSINRPVKLPEGNSSKNEIRVPQESSELRRSHLYTFHLSWTPRACIHWSRMVPPCQRSWWCISVPHAHRHASAHRDAKPRRGDRAPLTSTGLSSFSPLR